MPLPTRDNSIQPTAQTNPSTPPANNGNPGTIYNSGQQPEQSRYMPQMFNLQGKPINNTGMRGGYGYNLPTANGPFPGYNMFGHGQGFYPSMPSFQGSPFNPNPNHGAYQDFNPQPTNPNYAAILENEQGLSSPGGMPSGAMPGLPSRRGMPPSHGPREMENLMQLLQRYMSNPGSPQPAGPPSSKPIFDGRSTNPGTTDPGSPELRLAKPAPDPHQGPRLPTFFGSRIPEHLRGQGGRYRRGGGG